MNTRTLNFLLNLIEISLNMILNFYVFLVFLYVQSSSLISDSQKRKEKSSLKSALGPVWYMCLKTENCCLKTFVEIRVGEKIGENT